MTFRMQDLMIDVLPGAAGELPGRLMCGATSCAKSTPLGPEPPEEPQEPIDPACGPTSCGKSTASAYAPTGAHLAALRRQLAETLTGLR